MRKPTIIELACRYLGSESGLQSGRAIYRLLSEHYPLTPLTQERSVKANYTSKLKNWQMSRRSNDVKAGSIVVFGRGGNVDVGICMGFVQPSLSDSTLYTDRGSVNVFTIVEGKTALEKIPIGSVAIVHTFDENTIQPA